MTVSAQTPINRSTGNGVTTVFPYDFKILAAADIQVTVDGVAKTLNVDYTVAGVGNESGGNVTMTVAPANLTSVVRRRNMGLVRSTDYQDQGELPAATLDDDIDATVLMIQQVDEQIGRALTLPAGVVGVSAELPEPQAFTLLGWSADGSEIENYPPLEVSGSDSALVTYQPAGSGSVAMSVRTKLRESVSVKDFGAVGDGVTDDTAALQAACTASKRVVIPSGSNVLIQKTTLAQSDLTIVMEGDAKITVSNSVLTGSGIVLSGARAKIVGGSITLSGAGYFASWLVDVQSNGGVLDGVAIYYTSKPAYTGDGVNIPYNTGVVGLNQPYASVRDCNIYYGQGAGVWCFREDCEITNNRIHDNILGVALAYGGSAGYGDNCSVINNRIYDNNATTVSLSGGDGILSYDTKGHVISGNSISGSGEHGAYIQSTNNTITNNVVFNNYASGLKCGGAFNSTITGNVCYGNPTGVVADSAEIYIQSPFGNSTISNNHCSNTAGYYGIRCAWIEAKEVVGEEKNMIFSGNVVKGTYSVEDIRVSGVSNFTVSNNIASGIIRLSQSTTNHPSMTDCIVSGNTASNIYIDKTTKANVSNNTVASLTLSASGLDATVIGNVITAQSAAIGQMYTISEFSNNKITFTETVSSNPLITQSANAALNSNKRFNGNKFDSSGGRFINFTTSVVSGNYNQFVGNEFNGATQAVYTWGTNIQFVGNRALSTTAIGYLRGTNCLIADNLAAVSIEFPGSNTVANNLTPV